MKLHFKIILIILISFKTLSREVIIINYKENTKQISFLKKYLTDRFDENIVRYIKSDKPCGNVIKEALLNICVDEHNEIQVINSRNKVLRNTLGQI